MQIGADDPRSGESSLDDADTEFDDRQVAARLERPPRTTNARTYESQTVQQLYTLAQRRRIRGRSTMTKAQLIDALLKAPP